MFLNIRKHKKGSALYLAVVMLAILAPIALGLITIIVGQLTITRDMGYSVIAFCAADAGIERSIINWRSGTERPDDVLPPVDLGNEATYAVYVTDGGVGDCDVDNNYCVRSVGEFRGIHRSIEVNF